VWGSEFITTKAATPGTFWYFWLTIQNTTTSQARSLFRVAGVCISFCPWRALLLLWQLQIVAAAAARRHPSPPPF